MKNIERFLHNNCFPAYFFLKKSNWRLQTWSRFLSGYFFYFFRTSKTKMTTIFKLSSVSIFTLLVITYIPTSLNAIRCWQCAYVDGRSCPQDAKVNLFKRVRIITIFKKIFCQIATVIIFYSNNNKITKCYTNHYQRFSKTI